MTDPDPTGRVRTHLEATYAIRVSHVSALDRGVFRVDQLDGPTWVARVFPPTRSAVTVSEDAAILRRLEQAGFPAERCADAATVSTLDGRGVLVTDFAHGERAPGRACTYAILGALLGRLHSRAGAGLRVGGAWHHICAQGGPQDEIATAIGLVGAIRSRRRSPAVRSRNDPGTRPRGVERVCPPLRGQERIGRLS